MKGSAERKDVESQSLDVISLFNGSLVKNLLCVRAEGAKKRQESPAQHENRKLPRTRVHSLHHHQKYLLVVVEGAN